MAHTLSTERMGRALVDAAWGAGSLSEWEGTVLEVLARVGYDVAFLKTVTRGLTFVSRGLEARVLERVRTRWPVYSRELVPITLAARREGVATDTEVFGSSRRGMAYFRDLVVPQKGESSLYACLSVGGREVGGVMLGRSGGGFRTTDLDGVRALLGPLSLGAVAMAVHLGDEPGCAWPEVSPREAEVLRLVQLGYTNPEIAMALGSSHNIVRNQVASLLRKVGASTRSELVGLTLRP